MTNVLKDLLRGDDSIECLRRVVSKHLSRQTFIMNHVVQAFMGGE